MWVKIKQEVINEIVQSIEDGLTRNLAAQKVSISRQTLNNWYNTGKEDLENGKETLFSQFYLRLNKAEALSAEKSLIIVKSSLDPRSHQWFLERRHADNYGKNTDAKVNRILYKLLERLQPLLNAESFRICADTFIEFLKDDETPDA